MVSARLPSGVLQARVQRGAPPLPRAPSWLSLGPSRRVTTKIIGRSRKCREAKRTRDRTLRRPGTFLPPPRVLLRQRARAGTPARLLQGEGLAGVARLHEG